MATTGKLASPTFCHANLNVNPTKAQTEFENALAANGGVITDASSDALIKYMTIAFSFGQEAYSDYRGNSLSQLLFGNDPANNPSYLCSTFFNQLRQSGDPRTFKISVVIMTG